LVLWKYVDQDSGQFSGVVQSEWAYVPHPVSAAIIPRTKRISSQLTV
jgi:hypothetical protein